MSNRFQLRGLIAATFTPFLPGGGLNLSIIPAYGEMLLQDGVGGVFICGSTGEMHSLSVVERMQLAEAWVTVVRGRVPVVVHVGHHCLHDACALASHARQIGANAIASLSPSYHKPQSVVDLVGFCATIADAGSPLPFYWYHIPGMTGITFSAASILQEASERIPTLAGMKYSHSNFMELHESMSVGKHAFDIVFGLDEMLLAGLVYGLQGAVGSTYNCATPLYRKMIAAFQNQDLALARQYQWQSVQLVRTLLDSGLIPAGKIAMKLRGIDCGAPRSPLTALGVAAAQSLRDQLATQAWYTSLQS